MARSKVKSRSDHDIAHLHPLTNVPTKYQLPTHYGFWDAAHTNFYDKKFFNVKSTFIGEKKFLLWQTQDASSIILCGGLLLKQPMYFQEIYYGSGPIRFTDTTMSYQNKRLPTDTFWLEASPLTLGLLFLTACRNAGSLAALKVSSTMSEKWPLKNWEAANSGRKEPTKQQHTRFSWTGNKTNDKCKYTLQKISCFQQSIIQC